MKLSEFWSKNLNPQILIKINSKAKISQFHNMGPQILKETQNVKLSTLKTLIPHIKTDGKNWISFKHSKLQKIPKATFFTI